MFNAEEAREKATGYKDLKERIEEKVTNIAEAGGTSAIIMGVPDYTKSKEAVAKAIEWLEDKGYDVSYYGISLHIKW